MTGFAVGWVVTVALHTELGVVVLCWWVVLCWALEL